MLLVRGEFCEVADKVVVCKRPARRSKFHSQSTSHFTMEIDPGIFCCFHCRILFAKPEVPINQPRRVILL